MRSLGDKIIWSMVMIVSILVIDSTTFAQDLDQIKAGVVKISNKTGQTGTGFIVRVEPEVVYIITAAHVIAGDNQPKVEFFTKRNVPVTGAVLPGAEVNDDLRGLALVVVREKSNIPSGVRALAFKAGKGLVSGGEGVLVIGHPGGGGSWAVLKPNISNRVGRDISLDSSVASRFSGGPILVDDKVVGIMMSNQGGFGKGITHKSVLNYMEGFGVVPSAGPVVDESQSASPTKPLEPVVQVTPPPSVPVVEESKPSSPTKPLEPVVQVTPPASVPSQQLPQTKKGKDGAPMVLVPAGEFTMGSPKGEGSWYERPQHTVDLDAFYIDQYEVTVERYERFMKETKRAHPIYWDQVDLERDAQKPVVGINWDDAQAYCEWAGKWLPTEAEWEKAARGTDKRIYPWGASEPTSRTANYGKGGRKPYAEKLKAVGSYERGKSPYGAYDMTGNVEEWVADWFDADYYKKSPQKNPQGPSSEEEGPRSGGGKVLRGGSWRTSPSNLRSANRGKSFIYHPKYLRQTYESGDLPANRYAGIGVRCAQDAP